MFGVEPVGPQPWADRMEVVQPPLELTFSVTDDNLDAAAFLEAVPGGPTLVWPPYQEEQRRAIHDYLDDERPDRLGFYVERVELHSRLGLPGDLPVPAFPGICRRPSGRPRGCDTSAARGRLSDVRSEGGRGWRHTSRSWPSARRLVAQSERLR